MPITVKIHNLKELQSLMRRFPVPMAKNLNVAIKKSAFALEREAKEVTPVKTGRLKTSIFTRVRTFKATVSPNTDYAYTVHEGLGSNKNKGRRPYMEWGKENSKLAVDKYFSEAVDKTLKTIK